METLPKPPYVIPKAGEDLVVTREQHALNLVKELYDEDRIQAYAKLINGCNIIEEEYKFLSLLDEAYKSFLLNLHYTTVCLCTMANERLCYDLIDKSEIILNGEPIDSNQKEFLYNIPFRKLVDFLVEVKLISDDIKKDINQLADYRNKYLHPTLNVDSSKDAKFCLNKFLKIIDATLK